MVTGALCVFAGNDGFMHWYPLIYYPFLLLGECLDWWFPYLSPAFAKARNAWDYEAKFSRTTKLLAHQPGRRTPDANHIVLHLLSIVTAVIVYYDRFTYPR